MKKLLSIFILFALCAVLSAESESISLKGNAYSNRTGDCKNFFSLDKEFKSDDSGLNLHYDSMVTDKTYSYKAVFNYEKDINKKYDYFVFGDNIANSTLKINGRTTMGVGGGYYLRKDKNIKSKLSYALISRDNKLLNSFRYKYTCDFSLAKLVNLYVKCTVNYVTPENEMTLDSDIGFRFSKRVTSGIKYSYMSKSLIDLEDYSTSFYVGIEI